VCDATNIHPRIKYALTSLGERAAGNDRMSRILRHISMGAWTRTHGFSCPTRVDTREQVWNFIAPQLANIPVLYLEFGVYEGEATRYWSRTLKHPDSRLHGFDSFEGLPEGAGVWKKGQFDVTGRVPVVADSRAQFFKGWFDEVLPTYEVPPHEMLFVNMDADLYSSTIYVLRHLQPWIKAGSLIYFDELNHLEHEARAFTDFIADSGLRFEVICADRAFGHVLVRCLGR
jgi:hypothetical protein